MLILNINLKEENVKQLQLQAPAVGAHNDLTHQDKDTKNFMKLGDNKGPLYGQWLWNPKVHGKQYLVMLDNNLQKEFKVGVDYEFVANIHDEVQIQVKDEYADRVAEICVNTFPEVTEYFDFRILLEGEAKVGNNWEETH